MPEVGRAAETYTAEFARAPRATASIDHQTFVCQVMHRTGSWGGEMPSPGLALLSLRGKSFCGVSCRECWPCLTRHATLTSFRRNLSLVKELGDRAAQGRAYGNLGNTQYLLGNFSEAIAFHKEVGNRCAAFLVSGAETGCWGAAFLLACCTNSCQATSCSSPHQHLPSGLREGCCWLGNQRRCPRANCSWP